MIDELPVKEETIRRLKLFGFTTLESLQILTLDDLTLQFGAEAQVIYDRCRGIDDTPRIQPRPPFSLEGQIDLEEESIEHHLIRPLFAQLQHRLALRFVCTFSTDQTLIVNFAKPTACPAMATRLFYARLETLKLTSQPSTLHIAIDTTTATYNQLSLFGRETRRAIEACKHLRPNALMRVIWDEPKARLPERRAHLQSLLADLTRALCTPKPMLRPQVAQILEKWRIEDDWWTEQPIERNYFHARLANGADRRMFVSNGQWYR